MHHWDSIIESAIAPYPIVPTRRPNPLPEVLKSSKSNMPVPVSPPAIVTPPRESGPRPEARSAGMAERATRSENLSDLVRFFQTGSNGQDEQHDTDTDDTTALPTSEKDLKKEQMSKEVKPLHRRLLQFTQRQRKESSPKSKIDDNQRQIEALQREGYLIPSPVSKVKVTSTQSKESIDRAERGLHWPKTSVDQELSKSKMLDVETIGQPWLENKSQGTQQTADIKRLASLDMDDFSSMIDGAVSMSDLDDSVPPPYQAAASSGPSRSSSRPSSRHSRNKSSQYLSAPLQPKASSEALVQKYNLPRSPSVSETKATGSRDGIALRSTCSTSNLSLSTIEQRYHGTPSISTSQKSAHGMESPRMSMGKNRAKGSMQAPDRTPPAPPVTGASSPASLTLFPTVAPSRNSSKNAWRISAAPHYQTVSDAELPVAQTDSSILANEKQEANASNTTQNKEELGSRALLAPVPLTEPATAAKGQKFSRSTSLAMGTLKAFPLPAPTRPLPSIPISRKASLSSNAQNSAAQKPRLKSKSSNLQSLQPSPIDEDPLESSPRLTAAPARPYPEKVVANEDVKPATMKSERPSIPPEQRTPKRHTARISLTNVKDLPESPLERRDERDFKALSLAESPILGQTTPTRTVRRAASQGLQLNTPRGRKNLPFGLPSPPPSAALQSDPPTQSSAERIGHRSFTAPMESGTTSPGSMEAAFGSIHHRRIPSRSDSSQGSFRYESIPESYEPCRSESPIPSSDDEGCGPNTRSVHSHCSVKKQGQRTDQVRCGYENVHVRPSHRRLRLSSATRPLTPQSRGNNSFDKAVSPQSQYSQSTYRSQESQGSRSSHRSQSGASQASNHLEDRVAKLERQNQMLQAALLAALNAGAKPNFDLPESATSPTFPTAGLGNAFGRFASRPDSWMSSSRSSENSGFETSSSTRDSRVHARQLVNMTEDIESGWLSDKSSLSGARNIARHR
ncbi:hypothetical protein N7495_007461 [Penicillium taxi]|uniref:uncharacterized protein n=1 Tax=Penicillium taxi TaxID=168475 RepID=UPI0025457D69|nr:uncharacterized protein N7495_007461 [Penicillium taxi]KAJ5887420.1 hypothetical protein N7495_007461 [Penicillium taxi]